LLVLVVLQHFVVWQQQQHTIDALLVSSTGQALHCLVPSSPSCFGGESTVSYAGSSAPVVYCCGFS
jgi:hypothetical protein